MAKIKTVILVIFILMNAVVLLGQLWPEGAPAFARTVNVIFLTLSLVYFLFLLARKNK